MMVVMGQMQRAGEQALAVAMAGNWLSKALETRRPDMAKMKSRQGTQDGQEQVAR